MKKTIMIIAILLILVGCQSAPQTQSEPAQSTESTQTEPTAEAAIEASRAELIGHILAMKAGAVSQNISEEAKKQVQPEAFESQVYNILKGYTIEDYEIAQEEDLITVKAVAQPEHFVMSIYFLGEKLNGIFIRNDVQPKQGEGFSEEAVRVGPLALHGIVRMPQGNDPVPLVILMGGSGANDMDENIMGNRMMFDLAEGLAKQGVATLRFNDRFYEQAPDPLHITIDQEMLEDVASALELAKTLPRVDAQNIYYLGHSLGAMMGPRLLQDNAAFKGAILMAGTPRGLEEIIYDQNMNQLIAQKASDFEQTMAKAQLNVFVKQVQELKEPTGAMIMNVPDDYWHSLNLAAPAKQSFTQPLLILQGENDFQVFADIDLPAWKALYKDRKDVIYILYPGLSHLFMPGETKSLKDYETVHTIEPKVVQDIAEWIKSTK